MSNPKVDRPNIVYIHSHDSGRYVQPHGYAVPTPRIQRLAEEGMLFRQAFSAAPTCSPSRAALLTGMYPHETGMFGLAHLGFSLDDYGKHLVNTLGPAGYDTSLVGVQHVAHDPNVIGYDQILPADSRLVEHVAPAAVDYLMGRPDRPFFLDVGFRETHRPYPDPGPDDDARYCQPPATVPDTPETRADMAAYRASARQFDAGVGMVLDALEETGLADNTLVICTTDHGLAFPHMKSNLTQHGIGVMLILRGPGGFTGGQVSDAMVSHLDLFPTICELAAIAPPPWLQGVSLLPLGSADVDTVRTELFTESTYHVAYEPQRSVRTQRWSYIRRFDQEISGAVHCDSGPSKTFLTEHGWDDQPRDSEMLFDLIFDPNEVHNLAGDAAFATVLNELRSKLDGWMRKTSDPLIEGPIPASPAAQAAMEAARTQ